MSAGLRVGRARVATWAVCAAVSLPPACKGREPEPEESAPPTPPSPSPETSAPPPSSAEVPKIHAPAEMPFDFPSGPTSAKPGDFVLAPSRGSIDEALEHGGASQSFIYYGAWLREVGAAASKLKTLPGQTATIPNALILPVGGGESAKPGDVVLTAWASGSGLERAIVVEGGSPARPKVRYLDVDFDNPSGWGQKEDELPEKTFHVLTKPGELGTSFACEDGERQLRWLLVARAGPKLLGLGFAGKMRVLDERACTPLPIAPKLKPGDKVWVPVLGSFVEAKVQKLDAAIGRVFVERDFGGKKQLVGEGFCNVATHL